MRKLEDRLSHLNTTNMYAGQGVVFQLTSDNNGCSSVLVLGLPCRFFLMV